MDFLPVRFSGVAIVTVSTTSPDSKWLSGCIVVAREAMYRQISFLTVTMIVCTRTGRLEATSSGMQKLHRVASKSPHRFAELSDTLEISLSPSQDATIHIAPWEAHFAVS